MVRTEDILIYGALFLIWFSWGLLKALFDWLVPPERRRPTLRGASPSPAPPMTSMNSTSNEALMEQLRELNAQQPLPVELQGARPRQDVWGNQGRLAHDVEGRYRRFLIRGHASRGIILEHESSATFNGARVRYGYAWLDELGSLRIVSEKVSLEHSGLTLSPDLDPEEERVSLMSGPFHPGQVVTVLQLPGPAGRPAHLLYESLEAAPLSDFELRAFEAQPPPPPPDLSYLKNVTIGPHEAPALELVWIQGAPAFRGEQRDEEHLRITQEADGTVTQMQLVPELAWQVARPEPVRPGEVFPGVRTVLRNEPEQPHDIRAIWTIDDDGGPARLIVGTDRSTLVWRRDDEEDAFLFGRPRGGRRVLVRRALNSAVLLDITLPAPGEAPTEVEWVGLMLPTEGTLLHLAAVLALEAFAFTSRASMQDFKRPGAA